MKVELNPENRFSSTQKATLSRYKRQLENLTVEIARNRTAMASLFIIISFILLAIFASYIAPYDPQVPTGTEGRLVPPSLEHPMGTDHLSRDIFSQWVFGARVSLIVGFVSGLSVMVVGVTVGLISGYYRGTVDMVLMRIVDILYGIPATPLILVLALFFGGSLWNVVFAMALVLWRTMARVIRSQTLTVSERPFVKAARASGASDRRIMFVHIAPNLLPLIFIQTTFAIAWAIVLEAGISFLGLGAQEVFSWGTMLQLTFQTGTISEAWWWVAPPGVGITLLVLSVFYLQRAIEDIANPEVGGFE